MPSIPALAAIVMLATVAPNIWQAPLGPGGFAPSDIYLNVGGDRTQMKWVPAVTTMNMGAAMVPFRRVRPYFYLEGVKSPVRASAPPTFEVDLPSDMHAEQLVTLVRLKTKDEQRRIDMHPAGMSQIGRATFSEGDVIPLVFEQISGREESSPTRPTAVKVTLYRLTPKSILKPGEYALFSGWRFYDFGVD